MAVRCSGSPLFKCVILQTKVKYGNSSIVFLQKYSSLIRLKTLNLVVKLDTHNFRDRSPVFAQQHYLKSQRHCQVLASVCMSCPFWLFKEMHFKTAWEDEEPLVFSSHLSVILLFKLSQLLNLRSNPHRGEREVENKAGTSLHFSLFLKLFDLSS